MVDVTMSMEEYRALIENLFTQGSALSQAAVDADTGTLKVTPKKRKVSKYNREFGRQLKALKKKHPRSKASALMKRAHALTKKALKK
jgi:hypothetical protein